MVTIFWPFFFFWLLCCLTSTEAGWPIRDGDRVGKRARVIGSTAETARKRPERPWTAARTMEVLRRCPLAIAQRLVHCAIALSTAVLDRVTKTMSVAPLLTNNLDNSKQKMSNLLSPAPPPYSWSLLGKSEGPAPPPSSKISWSFDLAWYPGRSGGACKCFSMACFLLMWKIYVTMFTICLDFGSTHGKSTWLMPGQLRLWRFSVCVFKFQAFSSGLYRVQAGLRVSSHCHVARCHFLPPLSF